LEQEKDQAQHIQAKEPQEQQVVAEPQFLFGSGPLVGGLLFAGVAVAVGFCQEALFVFLSKFDGCLL